MAIKGLRTPIFGEYNYDGNAVTYTDGFVAGRRSNTAQSWRHQITIRFLETIPLSKMIMEH